MRQWDFPGGTVVKNPPANARGHRFDPWSGKIPHTMEQLSPSMPQLLSPHAATTEDYTPRARALQQENPLQ